MKIGDTEVGIGAIVTLAIMVVLGIHAWRNPGSWTGKAVIILLILNVISNIMEPEFYKKLYAGGEGT